MRKVQPTSESEVVLNDASIIFATNQFPNWRNQFMLAPVQMKVETVRDPTTKSDSPVYASSLNRSSGSNVPSGSQTQMRSPVASRRPRRIAAP